jgi:hypothetical protein
MCGRPRAREVSVITGAKSLRLAVFCAAYQISGRRSKKAATAAAILILPRKTGQRRIIFYNLLNFRRRNQG